MNQPQGISKMTKTAPKKPKVAKIDYNERLANTLGAYPEFNEENAVIFTGTLNQKGTTPALFSCNEEGEQKEEIHPITLLSTVYFSALTFYSSLFGCRGLSVPKGGEKRSASNFITQLKKMSRNGTALRGGIEAGKSGSTKRLSFDWLWNCNPDILSHNNLELGLKGGKEKEENSLQSPTRYTRARFFLYGRLDCRYYTPRQCEMLIQMIQSVVINDETEFKEVESALCAYLDRFYPLNKSGKMDFEQITDSVMGMISNYKHAVHKDDNNYLKPDCVTATVVKDTQEEMAVKEQSNAEYLRLCEGKTGLKGAA